MKTDILGISVHPDDIELAACGTVLKHVDAGYQVGIVDLTQGEMGTRGTAELRLQEAQASSEILGLAFRENLGLEDSLFEINQETLTPLVKSIRKYQPKVIIANALKDRHPDHGRAAELVRRAVFLSGLVKFETKEQGIVQPRWRPKAVYHYIQDYRLHPDLVIDITPFADKKMEAIMAFKSQFYDPNSTEPESPISSKEFLEYVQSADKIFGRFINVKYAEGFNVRRPIGVSDLTKLD